MANNPAVELMPSSPETPSAPVITPTSGRDGNGQAVTEKEPEPKHENALGLYYRIDESPPLFLSIFLAFQHYLTMFGSTVAIPLILAGPLCIGDDYVALSEIISTIFFVSGLSTLLQSTFGSRLPIVQGGTFSFLIPTFAILSLHGDCPEVVNMNNVTETNITGNITSDEWKLRMREIQGAIVMASLFQVAIGMTGLVGLMLQFIGPLAIAPNIALIGLSLFKASADFCAHQWWIAIMTIVLIAIFSQYMRNIEIPCCVWGTRDGKKGCHAQGVPIFKLFPIILSIIIAWIICAILTNVKNRWGNDILPADGWGQKARTDVRSRVLYDAAWFRFPYPFQWGLPKITLPGTFGMLAGVIAGIMESIGDYYACASLSGAPPPPRSAVNRGILTEGIACILAGMWGSGNGTTSYGENIGAIGITKVGSRRVIQISACIMIFFAMFGKLGALFVTIPEPIIGGIFMVMFGMISAVGISSLQHVDMNSTRNLFIFGFALFFGLSMPQWITAHPGAIQTGVVEVDQIVTVLLSTSMFVGGAVGLILDVTIPGTDEERGIKKWRQQMTGGDGEVSQLTASIHTYDFPFGMNVIRKIKFLQYIPICPTFGMKCQCCKKDTSVDNNIPAGFVAQPSDTDNGVLYHRRTEIDSTHL